MNKKWTTGLLQFLALLSCALLAFFLYHNVKHYQSLPYILACALFLSSLGIYALSIWQERLYDHKINTLRNWSEVINQLPILLWRRDENQRLIWCNQFYAQTLETDTRTALHQQQNLMIQRGEKDARELAHRAIITGTPQTLPCYLITDGLRQHYDLQEIPLKSGGTIGIGMNTQKVADLKSDLNRHNAGYVEMMEHLGSGMAIYGPDMRIKFYNQAYARIWHLNENWLRSQPTYSEIIEYLRERRRLPEHANFLEFKQQRIQLFKTIIEPHETMMYLPDGTCIRSLSFPNPSGGVIFVSEDVTSSLALETSYNTLVAVQKETLDHLNEAIAVFGSDGRLKLYNPAFARIWNLEAEDLTAEPHISEITSKVSALFPNSTSLTGVMTSMALDRNSCHDQFDREDGTVIEFSNVPLPDGNTLNCYLDITDSVHIERALHASHTALEQAEQIKAEFIAHMSYQLRNPLNSIMGFAEMLNDQYIGALTPKQQEYSKAILDSGETLLKLVNDILDLSSMEAGHLQLDENTIDIDTLLSPLLIHAETFALEKNIQFTIQNTDPIPLFMADEKRLQQALLHLIKNAFQFTPAEGKVTFEISLEEDWLNFKISDTGIGIPEQDQRRIFDHFEKSISSPHSNLHGAGLGLSLVNNIIRLHDGSISLKSSPNSGTEFTCSIPLRQAPEKLIVQNHALKS